MEKSELVQVVQDLDAHLAAACDVVIVDGAAMILYFGAPRATRDVDMLMLRGDVQALRQAIKQVASSHNLPDDWMNNAVKGFADILPPDFDHLISGLPCWI